MLYTHKINHNNKLNTKAYGHGAGIKEKSLTREKRSDKTGARRGTISNNRFLRRIMTKYSGHTADTTGNVSFNFLSRTFAPVTGDDPGTPKRGAPEVQRSVGRDDMISHHDTSPISNRRIHRALNTVHNKNIAIQERAVQAPAPVTTGKTGLIHRVLHREQAPHKPEMRHASSRQTGTVARQADYIHKTVHAEQKHSPVISHKKELTGASLKTIRRSAAHTGGESHQPTKARSRGYHDSPFINRIHRKSDTPGDKRHTPPAVKSEAPRLHTRIMTKHQMTTQPVHRAVNIHPPLSAKKPEAAAGRENHVNITQTMQHIHRKTAIGPTVNTKSETTIDRSVVTNTSNNTHERLTREGFARQSIMEGPAGLDTITEAVYRKLIRKLEVEKERQGGF